MGAKAMSTSAVHPERLAMASTTTLAYGAYNIRPKKRSSMQNLMTTIALKRHLPQRGCSVVNSEEAKVQN